MSAKPPIALRAVHDRGDPPTPPELARHHEEDLRDAVWLYEWSRAALEPIGEAVAARVTIAG